VPVLLRPNTTLEPQARWWSFQAWSVIDPKGPAVAFLNYLLPLAPIPPPSPLVDATQVIVADLFCTGHAWSQEGDFVVAGGATAVMDGTGVLPVPLQVTGAKFLFLFDPAQPSQPFPGQSTALYGGHAGQWKEFTNGLLRDRFYPTSDPVAADHEELAEQRGRDDLGRHRSEHHLGPERPAQQLRMLRGA
jgi:hypothetical protein